MGSCSFIKSESGERCNSLYGLNYAYLRDANGAVKREVEICQNHSDMVINELESEVRQCDKRIREVRKKLKEKRGVDYQTSKTKNEIKVLEERLDGWMKIKNETRNRKCRMCRHPLFDAGCEQCKQRHDSKKVSSATFFSQNLKRRETFLFHVVCGRVFFLRFGIRVMPTKSSQILIKEFL